MHICKCKNCGLFTCPASCMSYWPCVCICRSYCSRRIRRIRKSLHFPQGNKHKVQPKKITSDRLTDVRYGWGRNLHWSSGQLFLLSRQWNLLSTGPVGLQNFETQLLNLHDLVLILAAKWINASVLIEYIDIRVHEKHYNRIEYWKRLCFPIL